MSPIKRMTSAFSSAGDRSSRFPGGDMPFQNLKSLYVERPDLSIFTRAVAPCLPYSCRQQNLRCPDFCPYFLLAFGTVGARSLHFVATEWREFGPPSTAACATLEHGHVIRPPGPAPAQHRAAPSRRP